MGTCLICQDLDDILRNNSINPDFYDVDRWLREGFHDRGYRVSLNGEDVTGEAFAMLKGHNGFVARYTLDENGKRHYCETPPRFLTEADKAQMKRHLAAAEIAYGNVEFVKTQ